MRYHWKIVGGFMIGTSPVALFLEARLGIGAKVFVSVSQLDRGKGNAKAALR